MAIPRNGGAMMDEEEVRRPQLERPNLEVMGIAELEAYIADLEGEIARAREMIGAKTSHRGTAESFFKS